MTQPIDRRSRDAIVQMLRERLWRKAADAVAAMPVEEPLIVPGVMPLPAMALERAIIWPQEQIDLGETVWGLGDIDRGFQNLGIALAATRQRLAAAEELLRESNNMHPLSYWSLGLKERIDAFLQQAKE